MQIYIVPTYSCNLGCKKCYSKRYLTEFPNYLSWIKFIAIFKFFELKYNNFAFIGGEPTIWKFINESILFLRNKNKHVNVFTNGIIPLNAIPNRLIINGNNIFNPELKNKIFRNLSFYKRKRAKIHLRFNISAIFSEENIQEAVKVSKQFADSVSISILYPIENEVDYGKTIFDLSTKLYSESIRSVISRATPFCLFTQEQRDFLISNCKLKGKCALPTNSLVINPDGQTIQPCVELCTNHNIAELTKKQPKKVFAKDVFKFKSNQNPKCNTCNYYLNNVCWGGCLQHPLPSSG